MIDRPERNERANFRNIADSTRGDWDTLIRHEQVTKSHIAEHVLAQLRLLGTDDAGYPIDRLQHSLQTATRAEADGRDEEYILCALLHDIGDVLAPDNHPAIAAAVLKPYVSEANHWMVAHHDIFQGYYYWQHLDLDPNAREKLRGSPYFDHTSEFCAKYDSPSFDADYRTAPLKHFEALVRELLTPPHS